MDGEIALTNDNQPTEYDTNDDSYPNGEVVYPNCDIEPEREEGTLKNV